MNETSKKPQIKFNFFDLLILALAVLIIAAVIAVFSFHIGSSSNTAHADIEYTIVVKELPEELQVNTEIGDEVIDTVNLGPIGKISAVEIVPATYDHFNLETQTLVHGEYDDLISVYFTIASEADVTEDGYMIDSVRIAVGAQVYFRTPGFIASGYITEVTSK